jgi:ER lumen protein retaining receptor
MSFSIRILGDLVHLLSLILLTRKIWLTRSCTGVSLRTQELYLLVFVARYLDLFWNWNSLYNVIMKILFIGFTAWLNYQIRRVYAASYQEYRTQDSFNNWYLIVPCALLALFFNEAPAGLAADPFEFFWAFSIFLEAVAIYPQCHLHMARRGMVDVLTADYVFCLGAYRFIYVFSWIFRWYTDVTYIHSWLAFLSGCVQILLYCDFFYYYLRNRASAKEIVLPV